MNKQCLLAMLKNWSHSTTSRIISARRKPPFCVREMGRVMAAMCALSLLTVAACASQGSCLFIEEMTWPELRQSITSGTDSVLIFAGSVEETGPYVALGKHNFRARVYASYIARMLGHTLVAPIIPAVPCSGPLRHFPGTIDVPADVYSAYTAAIVRSMAAAGFKHVFLLGDHGGSQKPLEELAPKMDAELSPTGTRVYFVGDGYTKATAEILAYSKDHGLDGDGHGGLWDTSETWAANPGGVRPGLFAHAGAPEKPGGLDKDGVQGDPRQATPELGREFGQIRVRDATAQILSLLTAEKPRS